MPEVLTQTRPTATSSSSGKAMISAARIARRVRRLGRHISDAYADIETPLVLLVEDIVDSGRTAQAVTKRVRQMKPASLRLAALLDRPARRAVDVKIDFRGFVIPDRFVIGYGLDYAGLYRELADIHSLG